MWMEHFNLILSPAAWLDEKRRAYEYYQQAVDMNHREDEQPDLLDKLDNLRRELGEL